MTEYFRITGLNTIPFDARVTGHADTRYTLAGSPDGIEEPLTRQEILAVLPRLPWEIRPSALTWGLSRITFPFSIQGSSDADMEDARHDLTETLEDGRRYIATKANRGTHTVLQVKANNAANQSYKTIFYGEVAEKGARRILGDAIKESYLPAMQMTLYCEPFWRPNTYTNLVNVPAIYNHDDGDAGHDNYVDIPAANILGDVAPLLRVRVVDLNGENFKFIYLARRATRTPSSFIHWREAESATALVNWVPLVSATRSNGNVVEDPAPSLNTSGSAKWQILGASLPHYRGRFNIFASLWTDNIAQSQFRSFVRFSAPTTNYMTSQWKRLTQANTWQLVKLGDLILDFSKFGAAGGLSQFNIFLEYQKTAGVAAQCDYMFLLPVDESVMRLDGHTAINAGVLPDMAEMSQMWNWPWIGLGDFSSQDYFAPANLLGEPLTLQPGRLNRIYFKALSVATATDPFSAHIDLIKNNGATPTCAQLVIDYLPQYVSPLE